MPKQAQPKGPWILFSITVFFGLISTIATLSYYRYTTRLQDQSSELVAKQQRYEAEIADLNQKVTISRAADQVISTPVVTMGKNCLSTPFGNNLCIDVPVTHFQQRTIQVVSQAEDPQVKAQLETKLAELKKLSEEATQTQKKQLSLKEIVDTSRELVAPALSFIVSCVAIYIILSKNYAAESEKWAFGSLGTILGFWLK